MAKVKKCLALSSELRYPPEPSRSTKQHIDALKRLQALSFKRCIKISVVRWSNSLRGRPCLTKCNTVVWSPYDTFAALLQWMTIVEFAKEFTLIRSVESTRAALRMYREQEIEEISWEIWILIHSTHDCVHRMCCETQRAIDVSIWARDFRARAPLSIKADNILTSSRPLPHNTDF